MLVKHKSRRRSRLEREIQHLRKLAFAPPDHSIVPDTAYFQIERDSIIRARVLLDCALVEEFAALIIMNNILTDSPKWNEIKFFGRIKRYHIFYDDILGRLPARYKMTIVRKFIQVPKRILKTVERMLALRNVFAHVYTLDYTKKRDLAYKGQSILSETGFKSYLQDSTDAITFLVKQTKLL